MWKLDNGFVPKMQFDFLVPMLGTKLKNARTTIRGAGIVSPMMLVGPIVQCLAPVASARGQLSNSSYRACDQTTLPQSRG